MRFQFHTRQQKKYSASGFQSQMRGMFEESASSINYYIQYSLLEHEMTQELEDRLLTKQQEIGQLIGYFYGIEQNLADAFVQFTRLTFKAIEILRSKKNIVAFRMKWYEATDALVKKIEELIEPSIRSYLYKQISLTEGLIKSILRNDAPAQNYYYNEYMEAGRNTSDTITSGIINMNTNLFVQ